jgi:PAS domain S-box-containing protein
VSRSTDVDTIDVLYVDGGTASGGDEEFLERNRDRITVLPAADAKAALDRLADGEFDCIVSEYELPGMDGIEFLEAVRRTVTELPFFIYTDCGNESVAGEAIAAGVTGYVPKGDGPESTLLLAERIEAAVTDRRDGTADRRLSELAGTIDSVLCVFSADWEELLFVNAAYTEMFGGSVRTLAENPKTFFERIHPEDRNAVRRATDRTADGESVEIEFRVDPETEYRRWVRARAKPITDSDGDVVRIAGIVTEITERVELEASLEERTERLEAAQKVARVGSWRWDVETDDVVWSDEIYRILGYDPGTPAEPTFDDWLDAVHPSDRDRVREALETAMETGSYPVFEHRFRRPDGTVRWVRARGEVELDGDEVVGMTGTVTDITEYEKTRRRLDEQRQLYETLVERSRHGVMIVQDGEIAFVDPTMEELTGLSEPELLGRPFQDVIAPEYQDLVTRQYRRRIEGETPPQCYEVELLGPEGETRTIDLSVSRIQYRTEPATLATFDDITERRKRERRLEAVFDNTYQLTGLLETDGTVIEANQTALSFGDLDREEVIGETIWETPWFRGDEGTRQVAKRAVEVASDGAFFREQIRTQGGVRDATIDFSVSPLRNDSGEVTLLVAEGRDITELQRQREHLSVLQRYLRHNMRNDLNVIHGVADGLTDALEDPDLAGRAATIRQHADSLHSSAELVKDLSETVFGDDETIREVTIDAVIGAALDSLEAEPDRITGPDDAVDAAVEVGDQLERSLAQLFDSLLEHASPEGGLDLSVHPADETVQLTVECLDCEIPEMELSAFDAEGDRSATHHPSGMGLWGTKSLVESYGGAVTYEETPEGTVLIRVMLPAG